MTSFRRACSDNVLANTSEKTVVSPGDGEGENEEQDGTPALKHLVLAFPHLKPPLKNLDDPVAGCVIGVKACWFSSLTSADSCRM